MRIFAGKVNLMVRDRGATPMIHEPSMPPSKTLDDHAQELSATLRAAFETWLQAQNPNNEEMWIATDLLLKGIFGFVAPTLVQMLDLNERGAQTITQRFAQHLDQAIGRTSSMNHRPITAENVMPTCQLFLGWLAGDKAREQITGPPARPGARHRPADQGR